MGHAYSINQVTSKKFKGLELPEAWARVYGAVIPYEANIMIWGQSGSGKTTHLFQLVRELANHTPVIYNSLEEGLSYSIQAAYERVGINELPNSRVQLLNEPMDELVARLKKPRSRKVVVIDSIPYADLNWKKYLEIKEMFPNKILIWVGQAKGKEPATALQQRIRFDADVKIFTEGFRAIVTSRFRKEGGDAKKDIYKQGARDYWGEL